MKQLLLITFAALSTAVIAQPVISDGDNIPTIGYSAPISVATSSNVGGSGANQTWDFSNLFFIPIGTMNVIAPSSSSMGTSFPNSNLAYTVAGTSSFFKLSSGKFEVMAYTITSPGSGKDYSPNSRTLLKFPFSYQEQFIDTCQVVGDTTLQLTLTYDGYGTLVMSGTTYTDVIRIKEDYGNGVVDYEWYTLNPLIILMQYRQSSNNLFFTEVEQITTGVSEQNANSPIVLYPNPAKEKVYITVPAGNYTDSSKITFYNTLGETIQQSPITAGTNEIELTKAAPGVYFYVVENNQTLSSGKLIVE